MLGTILTAAAQLFVGGVRKGVDKKAHFVQGAADFCVTNPKFTLGLVLGWHAKSAFEYFAKEGLIPSLINAVKVLIG